MSEVVWNKYSKEEFNDVMKFSDGYIDFLSDSKTERACVKNAIALAKSYGYRDIKEVIENKEILKAQDKVYVNMMNKSIALMHIGSNPLEKGMNILGAHIDSPRLDLKQNPLYFMLCLLDTIEPTKRFEGLDIEYVLKNIFIERIGKKIIRIKWNKEFQKENKEKFNVWKTNIQDLEKWLGVTVKELDNMMDIKILS